MKPIKWLGNTYTIIKEYSMNARQEIGYNLDKIQSRFWCKRNSSA